MLKVDFVTDKANAVEHKMPSGVVVRYTPVYAMVDGRMRFFRNLRTTIKGRCGSRESSDDKYAVEELEQAKLNLMKHDGQFYVVYARYDDPFEFLAMVKEKDWTLETADKFFFEDAENGYTAFIGNVCEYSSAFYYVIFSEKMVEQLKEVVADIKCSIHE